MSHWSSESLQIIMEYRLVLSFWKFSSFTTSGIQDAGITDMSHQANLKETFVKLYSKINVKETLSTIYIAERQAYVLC